MPIYLRKMKHDVCPEEIPKNGRVESGGTARGSALMLRRCAVTSALLQRLMAQRVNCSHRCKADTEW